MRYSYLTLAVAFLLPVALTAQMSMMSRQQDIPLKPWAAPLYWQPSQPDSHIAAMQRLNAQNSSQQKKDRVPGTASGSAGIPARTNHRPYTCEVTDL